MVQDLVIVAGQVPDNGLSVPSTVPPVIQLSVYDNEIIAGTSLTHCTVTGAG